MLDLDHDITGLRGADYNPRKIDADDIATLAESIKRLGLVKPLIARNTLIVAGHQRSKALKLIGVTRAATYLLPKDTTTYDEVRFNQLHNGTDMDSGDEAAAIAGGLAGKSGFITVAPALIQGNHRARLANVRGEIAGLINAYGSWGGVVATEAGKIIHCAQYALAAALLRVPLTCYVIPNDREEEYRAFLGRQYGRFSYDGLPRDTYIQTFAQMNRLTPGSSRAQASTLYERHVLPYLKANPKVKVLDFGAGRGDYVKQLRRDGFDIMELEFFRRVVGKDALDITAIKAMVTAALASISKRGLYDVVVCDSVLNSVDCVEAETAVMTMINAFCREGGKVFFSGRQLKRIQQQDDFTKKVDDPRYIEFLDENNYSALYRKGRWFYQHFHDEAAVRQLALAHRLNIAKYLDKESSTSFQVDATKAAHHEWTDIAKAIEFEFNMKTSATTRLGCHTKALEGFKAVYNVA